MKKELTLSRFLTMDLFGNGPALLIGARKTDAVVSLEAERVGEEVVFYIEIDSKKYLAFFMKGEMLPANMSQSINQEHRAVLHSVRVRRVDAELLYDLELESPSSED